MLGFCFFSLPSAQAQYDRNCDCSWQGGDKRQYDACNATIHVSEQKRTDLSSFSDYLIEAEVDTNQCTNVNYEVYSENQFRSFGLIHVKDGSNTEVIDGSSFSSIPDIRIKSCVICQDKRSEIKNVESSPNLILKLSIHETSWVDIRDDNGNRLAYKSFRAGESFDVSTENGIVAFIGNADGVSVTYKGKPLRLIKEGVYAKFTIAGN